MKRRGTWLLLLVALMAVTFAAAACKQDGAPPDATPSPSQPAQDAQTETQAAIEKLLGYYRGEGDKILTRERLTAGENWEPNLDWLVFGMARYGVEDDYEAYLAAVGAHITAEYAANGKLQRPTEYLRFALAVKACGGNPRAVGQDGEGKPVDLLAAGIFDNLDAEATPDLMSTIYGLLVLNGAKDSQAAAGAETLIGSLLSQQLADGGFSTWSETVDVDATAMALPALAPYYESDKAYSGKTVKQAADAALEALASDTCQVPTGGFGIDFGTGQFSPESTSQVILALATLGIDVEKDARFAKGALAALLDYQLPGGGFHSTYGDITQANDMTSAQALYSLVGYHRFLKGESGLFELDK